MKSNKELRDILSLYELSLSIGGTLDLYQTISNFASVFMSKMKYNYISFWLDKTKILKTDKEDNKYTLQYSNPTTYTEIKELPIDHPVLQLLENKNSIQVSSKDSIFNTVIIEKNITGGCFVIYRLGSIGFIKLYDSNVNEYDTIDIVKVESLAEKLSNQLVACIYHERAVYLGKERKELIKKLNERDNYLLNIAKNFPGLFWIKDKHGEYRYINTNDLDLLSSYFQFPNENVVGKTDKDFFDANRLKQLENEDHELISTQNTIRRTVAKTKNGKDIWYDIVKFPIIQDDVVVAISCRVNNVTKKKEKDLILLLQSTIINSLSHAVFITNTKGKFLYSNPAFERITGYKNADIIDSTPSLLKSGLYDNHFYKNMYQILNSGEVFSAKMVDKDASGNLFHLEQTIAPVSHKSGKITHYISVFKDISEEVAMKEELFLSQQRWKLALDGAGIGVWDWNAATNEVFFSKKWKSMIGFKDDEIGKTLEEWSNRVHPEDIDKCLKDINKHFNGETEFYINEHRMKHKNGNYVWILDRGKAISFDGEGNPLRVVGTHTDISNLKEVENRLRTGRNKEKELNNIKSTFVSVTSHEFKTPLSTMLFTTEALIDYKYRMNTKQIDDRLNKIKQQINHLTQIVEDVLNIEEYTLDEYKPKLELGDIIGYIQIIVIELNFNNRIQFTTSMNELSMIYDKKMVYKIISNLLNNALKFSQNKVKLKVTKKSNWIQIIISDKGIGISKKDQRNIFEPFYRGENTSNSKGTGLGLNIVKEAVNQLNGKIEIKSKVDVGTTFYISLPTNMPE